MIGMGARGGGLVNEAFSLLEVISDPDAYKAKLDELAGQLEVLEKTKQENAIWESTTRAELERRQQAIDKRERELAELEAEAEKTLAEALQARNKYETLERRIREFIAA